MRDDRRTLSAGLHLSLSLAGCKKKEKHGDEVEREEPRPQDPVAVDSGNCHRYDSLLNRPHFLLSSPCKKEFVENPNQIMLFLQLVLIANVATTRLRDMDNQLREEDAIRSQSDSAAAASSSQERVIADE